MLPPDQRRWWLALSMHLVTLPRQRTANFGAAAPEKDQKFDSSARPDVLGGDDGLAGSLRRLLSLL
ncbi:MAG: hypothetical protein VX077_05075, partial [Pseudomonadota bacterium]|nr:hypothetical protein [Pseudomonadota bacterium]